MKSIQTTQATKKLHQCLKNIKKDMEKETKALAKGLYIAVSNASIKKGSGKKPKAGTKKADNGDWMEGPELKVSKMGSDGNYKEIGTAKEWITKLRVKTSRETYTDKNGKTRSRRTSPYNIVALKNQKKPGVLFEKEIWRKGSKGNLPYSWKADGLANYYLRKQWLYEVQQMLATVKISPATFKGESNNERVLKLLDEGGSGKGSRTLKGFHLSFRYNKRTKKTDVGITKDITKEYKTVKYKGYNIKRQVLTRVNRVLKKVRPSEISNEHWRQIGKGY